MPWRYVLSHDRVAVHRRRPPYRRDAGTLLVSWLGCLTIVAARLRWRWDITGSLPATGAVVVSRHTTYWDGFLASMLDPRISPVVGRDWRSPAAVGWLLTRYGVIWTDASPVQAGQDRAAQGGIVWIAPAGWERQETGRLHRGAAEIAFAAEVPVLALDLLGAQLHGLRRGRLELRLREVSPAGRTVEQLTCAIAAALR